MPASVLLSDQLYSELGPGGPLIVKFCENLSKKFVGGTLPRKLPRPAPPVPQSDTETMGRKRKVMKLTTASLCDEKVTNLANEMTKCELNKIRDNLRAIEMMKRKRRAICGSNGILSLNKSQSSSRSRHSHNARHHIFRPIRNTNGYSSSSSNENNAHVYSRPRKGKGECCNCDTEA